MPHWGELESLTIADCSFRKTGAAPRYIGTSPRFRSARFIHSRSVTREQIPFLADLPTGTRSLEVDSRSLLIHTRPGDQINTHSAVLDRARHLTEVIFVDQSDHAGQGHRVCVRGSLDGFIGHLDSVERLTTSPVALKDVASLAQLSHLTHLVLLLGQTVPEHPVNPRELLELLARSTSLVSVTVCGEMHQNWSASDKERVQDAAAARGVVITWLGAVVQNAQ